MNICPNCAAEVKESSKYCGVCGTPLFEVNSRYVVYNYHQHYAKKHHATVSFGKLYGMSLLALIPAFAAAIICPLIMPDGIEVMVIPIILTLAGIAAMIFIIQRQKPFFVAARQAIVYDNETQKYYLLRFNGETYSGWNTSTRAGAAIMTISYWEKEAKKAQHDNYCTELVQSYQEGTLKKPSIFSQAPVSVYELTSAVPVQRTAKSAVYRYRSQDGKEKTVEIANAYPLFDQFGKGET